MFQLPNMVAMVVALLPLDHLMIVCGEAKGPNGYVAVVSCPL